MLQQNKKIKKHATVKALEQVPEDWFWSLSKHFSAKACCSAMVDTDQNGVHVLWTIPPKKEN